MKIKVKTMILYSRYLTVYWPCAGSCTLGYLFGWSTFYRSYFRHI